MARWEKLLHVRHPVAWWSAWTAFFGNLSAVAAIKALGAEGETIVQVAGAVIVSLIVAAVAYGRERLKETTKEPPGEERPR